MEDLTTLKNTSKVARNTMDFMAQMLLNFTMTAGGIVQEKDMEALLTHINHGGITQSIFIPEEDTRYFSKLLKKYNVAYAAIEMSNPDLSTKQSLFVFRDTDNRQVQLAISDYKKHLDGICHELDPQTFFEANAKKGYYKLDGLSREELSVFREEAEHYPMDFTVVCSEKSASKYMILANHQTYLHKTIGDMLYMTSGEDGHNYVENLRQYRSGQQSFYKEACNAANRKEATYIVDANNPLHIISLANNSYVSHQIRLVKETRPNGSTEFHAVDEIMSDARPMDSDFLKKVSQFSHPVMVTEDSLPYLEKGSHTEPFRVDDQLSNDDYRKEIRKALRCIPSITLHKPSHKKEQLLKPGILRTYSNLPYHIIKELKAREMDGVYISGNDIAYHKSQEESITEILDQLLYKDQTPLAKKEAELYYRGYGVQHLQAHQVRESCYIVDCAFPNHLIFVDEHRMEIWENGQMMLRRDTDKADYEETLVKAINSISVPVFLNTEEYWSEDRQEIIESKIPDRENNRAIRYVQHIDDNEKEKLDYYMTLSPEQLEKECLTKKQKEILAGRKAFEITFERPGEKKISHHVDHYHTSKVREQSFDPDPEL